MDPEWLFSPDANNILNFYYHKSYIFFYGIVFTRTLLHLNHYQIDFVEPFFTTISKFLNMPNSEPCKNHTLFRYCFCAQIYRSKSVEFIQL